MYDFEVLPVVYCSSVVHVDVYLMSVHVCVDVYVIEWHAFRWQVQAAVQ
jgi:hypothetical protein